MILKPGTSQAETYDSIGGLTMAWDVVNPLLLLGSNSGDDTSISSRSLSKEDGLSVGEMELQNHVIMSMGVSNSGKTHTIFGDNPDEPNACDPLYDKKSEGIIPRIIDDLFFTEKDYSMQRMLQLSTKKKSK